MTALPSIHALRAIHDALASIHHNKGRQRESLQKRILGEICLWQMKSTQVDEIRQVG
jgi:hypothetical protein